MIYFVQQGKQGPIKIGYAADPYKRLKDLQTGSSEKLNLLAVIDGNMKRESELHGAFQKFRRDIGEWFEPDVEIFLYISNLSASSFRTITCPICDMTFLPNSPEETQQHEDMHRRILQGGLPYDLREEIKEHGYKLMASGEDGKVNLGRRLVAFMWWARARRNGLPDEYFEEYMLDHLEYVANTSDQAGGVLHTKWHGYG